MFSPIKCVSGKRAYEKEEDAEEALVQSRINSGDHGPRNIYLCNDCSHWHLTSKGIDHPVLAKRAKAIEIARTAAAMKKPGW